MTQEEKNKIILDNWDKEGLANGWVNEHIKNNELKQQVEYLQSKIDKAIEFCDYSFKNPWYVSEKELLGKIIDILKEEK